MGATDLLNLDCGPLVIVGGAEDKTGACVILRELVRLAGGGIARIAVLTVASEYPRHVGERYVDVLTRLGAGLVEPVHIERPGDADLPEVRSAVEQATAVYFTGGIQSRIANMVGGSRLEALLHERWRAGLLIGGTSAGAAAMSGVMIVGSSRDPATHAEVVLLGRGLGFVPNVIVDQHFSERRRLARLHLAVAHHPEHVGLGIDEDTGIVLRGDTYTVIGSGSVTILTSPSAQASKAVQPSTTSETRTTRSFSLRMLWTGHQASLSRASQLEASGAQ